MMDQDKGFSLIEVLISLALIATVAVTLAQQLQETSQLLTQMIHHSRASQFLDKSIEFLYARHE